MCDTSRLPLQMSQLGAYQDDLKAALNQATWKRSTSSEKKKKKERKCSKNYQKNLAQHIPLTRGCGVEVHACSPLSLWPVKLRQLASYGKTFTQNENGVTVHPRVFLKTTPEVLRIIEHSWKPLYTSAELLELALPPLYVSRKHRNVHQIAPRFSGGSQKSVCCLPTCLRATGNVPFGELCRICSAWGRQRLSTLLD